MNDQGVNSRLLACKILYKIFFENAYSNLVLNNSLQSSSLSDKDKDLVFNIVKGTVQSQFIIDNKIKKLSKQPFEKLNKWLLIILRVAIYQIDNFKNTDSAVINNTSCELAKRLTHKGIVSYVNAFIRNYLKQPELLAQKYDSDYPQSYLLNKITNRLNQNELPIFLDWLKSKPPIIIRVNENNISTKGYQKILDNNTINYTTSNLDKTCLKLANENDIKFINLPGYKDNLFAIQDETSAFSCLLLNPKNNDLIIDMCAAPGGKSIYISQLMNNTGKILSLDINKKRLQILEKNIKILDIKNIETIVCDSTNYTYPILADAILLDAPCTGTGVLNKKPDIFLHRQQIDIDNLIKLQRKLLLNAKNLLKPEGILIYSTCSIEAEENIDNINWFLNNNSDFELEDFMDYLPQELLAEYNRGYFQFLPYKHSTNGFFIAKLRKKSKIPC